MDSLGLPAPALFTVLATIIEIGAGLLVLVGYKTTLVSLGLAIYVLVSAFIGHSHLDDVNQFQHFMKNMAIVGGSLAFVAFGGGRLFGRRPKPQVKVDLEFPGRMGSGRTRPRSGRAHQRAQGYSPAASPAPWRGRLAPIIINHRPCHGSVVSSPIA